MFNPGKIINIQNLMRGKKLNSLSLKDRDWAFCWGYIGDNRTGKSLTALEHAKSWRASNPNGTIVSFDPQKRFTEVTDYNIFLHERKTWASSAKKLGNALLIIDELRILHPNPTVNDDFLELMGNRGEHFIDIMYIVHYPGAILEILTSFTDRYYIFATNSRSDSFEKKIPDYSLAFTSSVFINKYTRAFGQVQYPGPFPHMMVDRKDGSVSAMNIPLEHRNKINTEIT